MFKAYLKSTDGEKNLAFVGLSEGNIVELKKSKPISFPAKDIGITFPNKPNANIVIAYRNEEAMKFFFGNDDPPPSEWQIKNNPAFKKIGVTFLLDDDMIESLEKEKILESIELKGVSEFIFIYGKTEKEILETVREAGLIGPETQSVYRGFAPTDVPQSMN